MRLPECVAYEVAHKVKDIERINGVKHIQPLHIDVAVKIVNAHLLADKLKWYMWIFKGKLI